jgi:hypothetical protein
MKKLTSALITLLVVLISFSNIIYATPNPSSQTDDILDNVPPLTSFGVTKKKKVDLVMNLDGTHYTYNELLAKVNGYVIPTLQANSIDANVQIKTGTTKLDNGVYVWNNYEVWRWDPITNGYVQATFTGGNVTISNNPFIGSNNKIYYMDRSGKMAFYDVNARTTTLIPNTYGQAIPALDGNIYSVNGSGNLVQTISTSGYTNVISSGVGELIGEDMNGLIWYITGYNYYSTSNTVYTYNENTGQIKQVVQRVDIRLPHFLNNEGTLFYKTYYAVYVGANNTVYYVGTHSGGIGMNYGTISFYNTGQPGIIYLDCASGTTAACYPQTPNQGGYLNTGQAVVTVKYF